MSTTVDMTNECACIVTNKSIDLKCVDRTTGTLVSENKRVHRQLIRPILQQSAEVRVVNFGHVQHLVDFSQTALRDAAQQIL